MAHSEDTGAAPDSEELHDCAVAAEQNVEKLSTGLAQAGADEQTVQALSKIADILRKIGSGLAKGMKEAPPEPAHTMDSAMQETMADRARARQEADAGIPPA
jgi:hypothetical protein